MEDAMNALLEILKPGIIVITAISISLGVAVGLFNALLYFGVCGWPVLQICGLWLVLSCLGISIWANVTDNKKRAKKNG
jgi:hypothetical protein